MSILIPAVIATGAYFLVKGASNAAKDVKSIDYDIQGVKWKGIANGRASLILVMYLKNPSSLPVTLNSCGLIGSLNLRYSLCLPAGLVS